MPRRLLLTRSTLGTLASLLGALLTVAAGTGAAQAAVGPGHVTATATTASGLVVVGHGGSSDDGSPLSGGYVDVRFPDGTSQHLTLASLGLPAAATGDGFGVAVAVGDLNGDGVSDLVVGAHGYWEGADPTGPGITGRAWILFGGANGFSGQQARELPAPALGAVQAGSGYYGSSVAISPRSGPGADVWVGASGATVNGTANAGALVRFPGAADGTTGPGQVITESTAGVPSAPGAEEGFGRVLAPVRDGVVVGVPDETVAKHRSAGAVFRVRLDPSTAAPAGALIITQNSKGVPDKAETDDRFGSSVSRGGYAVGVPGEDVGTRADAGAVQLFTGSTTLTPTRLLTQDAALVPGVVEAGDQFGQAVAVGRFGCGKTNALEVAVGSPGETIGKADSTGTVTLLPVSGDAPCAPSLLRQGQGLPGKAEQYDLTGLRLATITDHTSLGTARRDTLLIASPGETIGTKSMTGRVTQLTFTATPQALAPLAGDQPTEFYGRTLGLDAG